MSSQRQTDRTFSARDRAGKFLTFSLDQELYGLEILKVREINGMMTITHIPRTPDYVKGVINLRGKVIPVLDLRLKFGLPAAEWTEETCIIVVEVDGMEMGIIVDQVSEVQDIAADSIEDPPALGTQVDTTFILGMGKNEDRVTILLDIDKVMTQEDLAVARRAQDDDTATGTDDQAVA